jgi:hypothetical protein
MKSTTTTSAEARVSSNSFSEVIWGERLVGWRRKR